MASDSKQVTCSGHVLKKSLKRKAQEITKTAASAIKKVFKQKNKDPPEPESGIKTATSSSNMSQLKPHQKCPHVEIMEVIDKDDPSSNKEFTDESKEPSDNESVEESKEAELSNTYIRSL